MTEFSIIRTYSKQTDKSRTLGGGLSFDLRINSNLIYTPHIQYCAQYTVQQRIEYCAHCNGQITVAKRSL